MEQGLAELTEKEKETLRLLLQGYDAKSCARALSLSVHTINERLRSARRKLSVSSSREAARMLHEAEEPATQKSVSKLLGEAPGDRAQHIPLTRSRMPRGWVVGGSLVMSLIAIAIAIAVLPSAGEKPSEVKLAEAEAARGTLSHNADAATVLRAREWLALIDQGRWNDSWHATATIFQTLNTSETWADLSEQVRVPLGDVQSREFIEQESVPAPPNGVEVVRFKTRFANRPEGTETVSLVREDGGWKVVGYWIG